MSDYQFMTMSFSVHATIVNTATYVETHSIYSVNHEASNNDGKNMDSLIQMQ